jgi:hypothetical protein
MHLQLEPDVAFGMHPSLGVIAAVADDRPYLDEVLRWQHFHYSQHRDVYLLPDDTPHNTALQAVARATRELQNAGLTVAADPRVMLPPPVPTSDGVPVRETLPAQSLTTLTDELHELLRSADVADVLVQILEKHHGVVGDLEEFIDSTAARCERLDTPNGRELAAHLSTIAHHTALLGERLVHAQHDLAAMPDVTLDSAPPLADVPLTARHESPVAHTARARAAISSSPNHSANRTTLHDTTTRAPAVPAKPRRTR